MAKTAVHGNKFRIKKGDTVEVIQGKETGKRGKVMRVLAGEERAGGGEGQLMNRHVCRRRRCCRGAVIQRKASMHISTRNWSARWRKAAGWACAGRRGQGRDWKKVQNVEVDKGERWQLKTER